MDETAPDPASEGVPKSAAHAARELSVLIVRLLRRLREVAGDDTLSPSQVSALTLIGKHGAATASALASAEGVRPQSMATTLAALRQQGLIERGPDPSDGRRRLVTLTDAGRARIAGDRRARQEWLVHALDERYDEDERQALLHALRLLERLAQP